MDGSRMLYKKVDSFLKQGDFVQALELIKTQSDLSLMDILSQISADKSTLYCYSFLISRLLRQKSAENHYFAFVYLAYIINFYSGAYGLGLYHLRAAISLDPENIEYKEGLLFLHRIPERIVDKQEAIKVAEEILGKRPDSEKAMQILSDYGIYSKT